jgi:shikimate kinase
VLVGFKASGKSTVGRLLAEALGIPFEDTDSVLEGLHEARAGEHLSFREIYRQRGEAYFRDLEGEALRRCLGRGRRVVALGGGTPGRQEVQEALRGCTVVYLKASPETLWERMQEEGLPAFLNPEDPRASLRKLYEDRVPLYEALADLKVVSEDRDPESIAKEILTRLKELGAPSKSV